MSESDQAETITFRIDGHGGKAGCRQPMPLGGAEPVHVGERGYSNAEDRAAGEAACDAVGVEDAGSFVERSHDPRGRDVSTG